MLKMKDIGGLVVCFAIAFTAAAVGSVASIQASAFYQELATPAWAPPGSVFGPVWTILYAMMAVASWLVWKEGRAKSSTALTVYLIQLVLNGLWSWIFFGWKDGRWAFIEILFLWAMILFTILLFWRIRKPAALLLIPYLLWVTFATFLTLKLWQLNPGLLSCPTPLPFHQR